MSEAVPAHGEAAGVEEQMLASTGWPDRQPVAKHGPGLLPQWQPPLATTLPAAEDRIQRCVEVGAQQPGGLRHARALREEVDYGIDSMGLPVIVVYPDFSEESDIIVCGTEKIRKKVKDLWDKLPRFRDSMGEVPTIHVPNKKALIKNALEDDNFKVQTKCDPNVFFFPC